MRRYTVTLTKEERDYLNSVVLPTGTERQRVVAHVLLLVDCSQPERQLDVEVAESVGIAQRTVLRIKQRCVEKGMHFALSRTNNQHLNYPDPAKVALAQQLRAEGKKPMEICTTLAISRPTLYRWLRDAKEG